MIRLLVAMLVLMSGLGAEAGAFARGVERGEVSSLAAPAAQVDEATVASDIRPGISPVGRAASPALTRPAYAAPRPRAVYTRIDRARE